MNTGQNSGQHFPACYAIIVAGGTGNRMQNPLPKQFITLQGKPVLMHTLQAFQASKYSPQIILVLHEEYYAYWEDLCRKNSFKQSYRIVKGGDTRYQSVKNGLALVPDDALVAIHDAARPLVSPQLIDQSFEMANIQQSAIAAIQATDTIRQKNERTIQLNRNEIYLMQTPQTFKSYLLKEAYKVPYHESMTDDASVWEKSGREISLIPGERRNIKITWPDDIELAELFLQVKKPHV